MVGKQRLTHNKIVYKKGGHLQGTPAAAGAQDGDWAKEAGPGPGKKPGSEEEDTSKLSCKMGAGSCRNGFKCGT